MTTYRNKLKDIVKYMKENNYNRAKDNWDWRGWRIDSVDYEPDCIDVTIIDTNYDLDDYQSFEVPCEYLYMDNNEWVRAIDEKISKDILLENEIKKKADDKKEAKKLIKEKEEFERLKKKFGEG